MSTDRDWQAWGERDPYYGVLSHERFRRARLTPHALEEFFQLGRDEVHEVLAECRRHVGDVTLSRTLDFGCGVGRLLIPLSELSDQCVGVDVSGAMRAEAMRNCEKFHRHNVRLAGALGELGDARFTFVHSYIVLQHIDPRRGLEIIADLLGRLDEGGSAALHVTYGRTKYAANLGVQQLGRRLFRGLRRPLSRLARRLRNRDPEMQMNAYDINRVLFVAQRAGVRSGGFRFTDHGGHLGLIFYFKRG